MKPIEDYLARAVEEGASDIHLVSGQRPTIRVAGQLHPIENQLLASEKLREAVFSLLGEEQRDRYLRSLELDFSHASAGARFRVNLRRKPATWCFRACTRRAPPRRSSGSSTSSKARARSRC